MINYKLFASEALDFFEQHPRFLRTEPLLAARAVVRVSRGLQTGTPIPAAWPLYS